MYERACMQRAAVCGREIFIFLIPPPQLFRPPLFRRRRRRSADSSFPGQGGGSRARPVSGLRSESRFRKSFLLYTRFARLQTRARHSVCQTRNKNSAGHSARAGHRRVPLLFFFLFLLLRSSPTSVFISPRRPLLLRSDVAGRSIAFRFLRSPPP